MGLLEPWHIIIIALAFLFFFGGKKIPELMRGLGRGMKEFKDAQNGETAPPPTSTPTATTEEKPKN
ncbi:MAG: twin-arginine translocase TatA/TatE family subunit [Bacteroidetes bacterium]|nr:twin-arginine translocase TatA/TatE family subunit [Bacteroidota bacterium]